MDAPCQTCGIAHGVIVGSNAEHLVNFGALNPGDRDRYRAAHPDFKSYDWTKAPDWKGVTA